jgi:threonine/homoserine/homoserine lactone efflux protein
MATALWSLLAGAVFGLALAAPPGPMNAVIAEESVRNGWFSGVRAGLGAMTADATFFVLALLGLVGVVQRAPTIRGMMVAIGGGLMLYFAYGAASDALGSTSAAGENAAAPAPTGGINSAGPQERTTAGRSAAQRGAPEYQPRSPSTRGEPGRGFRKAFALAITNPYQLVFWLTVGVRLLDPGTVDVLAHVPGIGTSLSGALVVETGSPALVVGFFGGIAVWILAFPTALVRARRRLESAATIIAAGSATILAGYGVLFLVDAATTLL